eukprot:TRINITY_DN17856_c0_g1_i1.p1 TRINITY_DN17856_c0_g1~~TRINITY_DN17856_c0_g1_i1.p1  ORF type:complete len:106 (-),score=29.63 TRINITY_DN17856_c0_g1_i1:207-524(-)
MEGVKQHHGEFDWIIASDIIYREELLRSIWTTIDFLLSKREGSAVLISHAIRFERLDKEFARLAAEHGFQLEEIDIGRYVQFARKDGGNELKLWMFKKCAPSAAT